MLQSFIGVRQSPAYRRQDRASWDLTSSVFELVALLSLSGIRQQLDTKKAIAGIITELNFPFLFILLFLLFVILITM